MHIHKSQIPPATIPNVDIFTYLFAKQDPTVLSQPLYVDGVTGRTVTHGQQKQYAEAFHAALVNPKSPWGGFKAGQVIGTFSPNNLLFPTVLFGTIRAGGIVTTNNHTYTTDELVHQLKDSGASMLITHPEVLETALAACKKVGIRDSHIIIMEGSGRFPTMDDVLKMGTALPVPPQHKIANPSQTVAYLAYSSGTTGLAKGVKIAHSNVIANCQQIGQFAGWEAKQGIRPLSKGDKTLGILPSYHIYALVLLVHYVCKIGSTTVWLSKFDLPVFLDTIQKYKISVLYLVPPIMIALAKHPIVDKYDLSAVREVFSGAAPLGADVAAALRARLGQKLVVRQGYGLTESATVTHMAKANTPDGSVGILVPNVEVRLVDPETGKDAEPGKEGEVWIRSPSITLGYLNNEKATNETFVQGWLHTGDVAIVDKDGQFYIVDRIKELIKVKGLQVAPAELEALLLSNSNVMDCMVVQTPSEREGELPKAFVVLSEAAGKRDAEEVRKELYDFVAKTVARHKRLDGGIEFVDIIPKSPSGKLLRRVFRDKEKQAYAAKQKASKL